ncbi:MAG: hypothetical protein J0M12_15555 [Deltaproteobacteria bacterium]|nr:hypothetical protein [Deltaproteobacteria bacterium]
MRIAGSPFCSILCAGVLSLALCNFAYADTRSSTLDPNADPRGNGDLVICSQNLENFGSYTDSKLRNPTLTPEGYREKERALAQRMASKSCDVIGVQEVLGKDDETALAAMRELADTLRKMTNRFYEVKVGPTLDKMSHVGFLVAKDRAEVQSTLSFAKVELPKISPEEKPRLFIRAPLEIQIRVKGSSDGSAKTVVLLNFHFKSRRGGSGDPAELEWETYRMAMAEGIRRITELRHGKALSSAETILVLLGDRNSNYDCASAKILEGSLVLKNFQDGGSCRLSKRGVPLCQQGSTQPAEFFSVLTNDPQTKLLPGTQQYKEEFSWIDDILMPSESLRTAWARFDSPGDYESGVVYKPKIASDHAMVWVKLNW